MFTAQGSRMPIRQIGCKVTTKNAHTQVMRAIFSKKIDLSICIQYSAPHSSSLECEVLDIGCKKC